MILLNLCNFYRKTRINKLIIKINNKNKYILQQHYSLFFQNNIDIQYIQLASNKIIMGNQPHKLSSNIKNKSQGIQADSPIKNELSQIDLQNLEQQLLIQMHELNSMYTKIQKKVKHERKKIFQKIEIAIIPFKSIYDDLDHIIKSSNINIIFTLAKQSILDYVTLILRIRKKLLTLYDSHVKIIQSIDEKLKESVKIKNSLEQLKESVEQLMPFYQENDFLQNFDEKNQEDLFTFILQKWIIEDLDKK
ncbi:hypothetical protein TTHERM_000459319 (macronuclear) [Tetrahymena thermophila SB210]|uniref:Uncharacterized protein n=1 Tax=Tetrahymena thermophila (strain SB210) TaxID=312017 RepID=W7X3G0_TETTS|nr:hypothetical protein TTHERM_000459319 [Tetrahymena thermophila SB210]EWS71997.1 hypothetical protein TTHERM_000459319 [Tetrahymena thermophila SB210]|eukprot:XP_012655497.1 hypothetical protein TTHERM_000459319 [Tetrahymena thermophila SB210]